MNSKTGAIALFETAEDARRAGFDVPLTDEQVAALGSMERQTRLREAERLAGVKQPEFLPSRDRAPVRHLAPPRRFKTRARVSR